MKIVLLLNGDAFEKNISDAAIEDKDAIISKPIKSNFLKKVFYVHNSWHLNKHIELPFKRFWYKRLLDEKKMDKDEVTAFIFFESFQMSFSKHYLKHLRKKFKNSYFFFTFLNPVEHCNHINHKKYLKLKEYYDYAIVFSKGDELKYGYTYYNGSFYKKKDIPLDKSIPESDVFFVGKNKGRLNLLLDLYEKFIKLGLKCDFHIVEVEEKDMKYKDDIHYNEYIPYEDALKHMMRSKCILELLPEGCNYCSLRTVEALMYKKKLITTNKEADQEYFYDKSFIDIISDKYEPSKVFFEKKVDDKVFENLDFCTFARYKRFITKLIEAKEHKDA